MLLLKREQDNTEDKFAVAVVKSGAVVGHVPKKLVSVHFIRPFLLGVNFCRKNFTPRLCFFFWLLGSELVKMYGSSSYSNFNISVDD